MFDKFRDIIASYKAAALIRNAEAVRWEASRPVLSELGIARGWNDNQTLLHALYRGKVGVRGDHDRPDVRTVVDLRDGRDVATLFIRAGYRLP